MTDDDDKAKSIPKKPCHDNGPDLPDWEEQHDAGTYESGCGIKISVLKNCADDPRELADMMAERTKSQVVQVIGKKIVLYKEGKDKNKKIQLP